MNDNNIDNMTDRLYAIRDRESQGKEYQYDCLDSALNSLAKFVKEKIHQDIRFEFMLSNKNREKRMNDNLTLLDKQLDYEVEVVKCLSDFSDRMNLTDKQHNALIIDGVNSIVKLLLETL